MSNSDQLVQLARSALTTSEAAQLLKVSGQALRWWADDGVLPRPVRVGSVLLWDRASIEELKARRDLAR